MPKIRRRGPFFFCPGHAFRNAMNPQEKLARLLRLFAAFARIGLFTFGGGYAMLPMLQKEVVEKHGWATEEDVLDFYAVGQCTPGVIAVNTATFIGCRLQGIPGAIAATLGVITPSLVIITAIAAFLRNFASEAIVRHAFGGIRVAVAALVLQAVVKLWKTGVKDILGFLLFAAAFAAVALGNVSPVFVVAGAVAAGLAAGRTGLLQKLQARQAASAKAKQRTSEGAGAQETGSSQSSGAASSEGDGK